jgi:predicted Zn-dependent peptidase
MKDTNWWKKCTLSLVVFLLLPGGIPFLRSDSRFPYPGQTYKLKNGLTIILSPGSYFPIVALAVGYRVGPLYEQPKQAGISYLLENLMFQGSQNVGRMQHVRYIQRVGGILNVLTSFDRMIFYQSLPSHHLPLAFWLESDRMARLSLTRGAILREIIAVVDEIKFRHSRDPYLEYEELFNQLLFPLYPYYLPLYGSKNNLASLSPQDIRQFYSRYFCPRNAVVCVAGNFDEKTTLALFQKYFSSIPPGSRPSFKLPPLEKKIQGKVERTVGKDTIPSPAIFLGFPLYSVQPKELPVLQLIEYVLLHGRSSRLQKRLFIKERLVLRLSGGLEMRGRVGAFKFFLSSTNPTSLSRAKRVLWQEINKLKSEAIKEEELIKAKRLYEKDFLQSFLTASNRAVTLIDYFFSGKSVTSPLEELKKIQNVTPSDIAGIMNRYFTNNYILINVEIK